MHSFLRTRAIPMVFLLLLGVGAESNAVLAAKADSGCAEPLCFASGAEREAYIFNMWTLAASRNTVISVSKAKHLPKHTFHRPPGATGPVHLIIAEFVVDPEGRVFHWKTLIEGTDVCSQAFVAWVEQWCMVPLEVDGVAIPAILIVSTAHGC